MGIHYVLSKGMIQVTNLSIHFDFELVLAITEVHDLVEGDLGGIPLVGLPHQLFQLLLLLLSWSQLACQIPILVCLWHL